MHIKRIQNQEPESAGTSLDTGLDANSVDTMWQSVILALFLLRRNPPNAAGVHAMWRRTKGKRGRHTLYSFRSIAQITLPSALADASWQALHQRWSVLVLGRLRLP